MKKIYLILLAAMFVISFSYAQWTGAPGDIYYNTGNVGIGTATPIAKFNVVGCSLTTGGGGLSISSGLTTGRLTTGSVNSIHNWLDDESLELSSGSSEKTGIAIDGQTSSFGSVVRIFTGGNENVRLLTNGNFLIGQTSQVNSAYKLDVAGYVRVNEIVVNTTGADFVFNPSYKLFPLSTLKRYIDKNHHLPEVPSAKQMQAEGLNVGDNQVKLLQKVEELTLYLIEKDKQLKEQQSVNQSQAIQLNFQQKEIDELKKQVSVITKPKL